VHDDGEVGMSSEIRVRLFGGFEVWQGDRKVEGFESQKARALLAYLISQPDRVFSREQLAGLLWPERDQEAARHALRQAIYNLRSALPETGDKSPLIVSNSLGIQLNPLAGIWTDVAHFEEALRRGRKRDSFDPHQLSTAAQLYRGDFLTGFYVKNSEAFEEWLVTEQERLRESAIEGLRTLIDIYSRRGEYRIGIHFARRLMAIEPLSEEVCRDLMRMCSRAGRRNLALAEYERFHKRLQSELGVDPLRETRELYQAILQESSVLAAPAEDDLPVGPLIPLVGRAEPLALLRRHWQRVLAGQGQLTLVTGEPGMGKTRLVRSFLDAATSQQKATVLQGQGSQGGPTVPFQMIAEILASAVTDPTEMAEQALAEAPGGRFADLALLCPLLRELRADLLLPSSAEAMDREVLCESVARFLEHLCAGTAQRRGTPLILLLDDVDLADGDTLELLEILVRRLAAHPVWFLATSRSVGPVSALLRIAEAIGPEHGVQIPLGDLGEESLWEIAGSLVGGDQAPALVRWLDSGAGRPLVVAELVNFLWSEGLLVPAEGRWTLARDLPARGVSPGDPLRDLVMARIRRLPSSTRRLASLAAVAGSGMDSRLLAQAADEHRVVVDLAFEILLERWLIRQRLQHWASGRREPDIVLWQHGVRQGHFEFAHASVRRVLYEDIPALRRQILHGQIAAALEEIHSASPERPCELLAHHYMAAGVWHRAFAYLEMAAVRASSLGAWHACVQHCEQALHALDRLEAASPGSGEGREARRRIQRLRDDLASAARGLTAPEDRRPPVVL
jgi:DNA-binding SARP family transcriptional activator